MLFIILFLSFGLLPNIKANVLEEALRVGRSLDFYEILGIATFTLLLPNSKGTYTQPLAFVQGPEWASDQDEISKLSGVSKYISGEPDHQLHWVLEACAF